jgi:hypothetical protein
LRSQPSLSVQSDATLCLLSALASKLANRDGFDD